MTAVLANPRNWPSKRLRFVSRVNKSRIPSSLRPEDEISFVPMAAIGEYGGIDLFESRPIEDVGSGYTPFIDNDVLIAKITPCFENGKGALATQLQNGAAFGTTELHVVSCGPELLPEFAFYLSICTPFRYLGEASMYGAGGQKRVPETFVKDLRFGVPPLEIQRAILAFLHTKLGEIDDLIAKKRDLLGLLAEKRSALLTRAVTKGVDPTAPMKSTDIDWLGDIPAHWDSSFRLKFLTTVTGGLTPATANADYWRGDIPWVSPKDMKVFDIADSEDHVTELALEETSLSLIDPGAVLFVVRGMILAHTFPIAVNSVAVTLNQDMKALRCGDRLTPKFLAYFLRGIDRHILSLVETSAHGTKALRSESWREVNVPLPPREEQFTILAKIDDGLAEIDKSAALIRGAIDQLTEYRAAIVTYAVTGELEVT